MKTPLPPADVDTDRCVIYSEAEKAERRALKLPACEPSPTGLIKALPKDREVVEKDRRYKPDGGRIVTTAGRCIFNDVLPKAMSFYNYPLGGKAAGSVSCCSTSWLRTTASTSSQ
jgi:hypothetical protein